MDESLIERIERHEGYREFPYKDTLGNYTIGIGQKITRDQAENSYLHGVNHAEALGMLEDNLKRIETIFAQSIPWFNDLDRVRQGVILEMAYQMGVQGVLDFHHMIEYIKDKNWGATARAMLDSAWHEETPARCEELSNIMLNGEEDA